MSAVAGSRTEIVVLRPPDGGTRRMAHVRGPEGITIVLLAERL